MSVLALPQTKAPASITWALEHNVGVMANPLGNTIQRVARSGARWRASIQFPALDDDDAGILASFLDAASRGDRWLYLSPPQNAKRRVPGAWSLADVITNGDFLVSANGWEAESNVTLSSNARRLRLKNSSGSPAVAGGAKQNLTLTASAPYAFVVDTDPGDVLATRLQLRRQSDQVVEAQATGSAPGRIVVGVTPSVAAMQVRLVSDSDGYLYFRNVVGARCLLVNGGSQLGNRLNVDGAPLSTSALLKAGEFVCVKANGLYELKRLTSDFDSDGSGAGALEFEPALRSSPADNDPVIVHRPFARFILAAHQNASVVSPPYIHGITFEAVEDVTA